MKGFRWLFILCLAGAVCLSGCSGSSSSPAESRMPGDDVPKPPDLEITPIPEVGVVGTWKSEDSVLFLNQDGSFTRNRYAQGEFASQESGTFEVVESGIVFHSAGSAVQVPYTISADEVALTLEWPSASAEAFRRLDRVTDTCAALAGRYLQAGLMTGIVESITIDQTTLIDADYAATCAYTVRVLGSLNHTVADLPRLSSGTAAFSFLDASGIGTFSAASSPNQINSHRTAVFLANADGDMLVYSGIDDPQSNLPGPQFGVAVKGGNPESYSRLPGRYHFARLTRNNAVAATSSMGRMDLDDGAVNLETAAVDAAGRFQWSDAAAGDFEVVSDDPETGNLLTGHLRRWLLFLTTGPEDSDIWTGGVKDSGDVLVLGRLHASADQGVWYAVKAGAEPYGQKSLNGMFYLSEYVFTPAARSAATILVFDGEGQFAFQRLFNNREAVEETGLYTVNEDGTFVLAFAEGEMLGALGADRQSLVLASTDPARPGVAFGVKNR